MFRHLAALCCFLTAGYAFVAGIPVAGAIWSLAGSLMILTAPTPKTEE